MDFFIKGILLIFFFSLNNLANGQRFLIIPSVRSIPEIRTAERISLYLESLGTKPSILIHQTDLLNLQEKSVTSLPFGNSDELLAALAKDSSVANKNNFVLNQIKEGNLLKTLSREKYETVVCNVEDPICHYIGQQLKIQNKIHLLYNCPKHWSEVFYNLPSSEKFSFSKLLSKVMSIVKNLLSRKSKDFTVEYKLKTLYLSQCFQPCLNPQPSLENIFPVGSFIGTQPKQQLPDVYNKPILLASKIVLVYLGDDEAPETKAILLETFKAFPNYFFLIVSKTFEASKYALGNVIVDANAPLDEILSSNKIAMVISNGDMTILLNSLFHAVPSITIGNSQEGTIGRQFIKNWKYGIDLSQKKLESNILQEAIREIVFDGTYRTNSKNVATYLKGMNTNYLVPQIIYNFFSAKGKSHPKTDL